MFLASFTAYDITFQRNGRLLQNKKKIFFFVVFLVTSTKITKLHNHTHTHTQTHTYCACNARHVDLQLRCFVVATSGQKIRDVRLSSNAENCWRTCPALTLLWSTYLKKLYQLQSLFSYPNITMEIKSRMVRADTYQARRREKCNDFFLFWKPHGKAQLGKRLHEFHIGCGLSYPGPLFSEWIFSLSFNFNFQISVYPSRLLQIFF
jgi:hypothetical protein